MDPYKVLGVPRGADDTAIKKAYRQLAKEFHPDRHPGDSTAADRFKEVSAAYSILGNEASRQRFDMGEIDGFGAERRRGATSRSAAGAYSRTANWSQGRTSTGGEKPTSGADDFFSELFGKKRTRANSSTASATSNARSAADRVTRGMDQSYNLTIDFLTAVTGGSATLTLKNDRSISVKIPKGVKQGQQIRLKGQGAPSIKGGENGDALVTLDIADHPYFDRLGNDIHVEVPVTLKEAVLGAKITAPTPWGQVSVTVPKGSNTGSMLRLKDKGIVTDAGPQGHCYLTLRVVLPAKPDAELEAFARSWKADQGNVRANLK